MSHENELTPAERELETALRSLRPTTTRIDPIAAARAVGNRTKSRPSHVWQMAAAAMLAAVAGSWLTWEQLGDLPRRGARSSVKMTVRAYESRIPRCSIADYRQALANSTEEFEYLLDLQAAESARDRFASDGPTTVWNADYRSSIGEM